MPYKNKEDRLAFQRRYYARRREEYIKLLGGECVNCGSTESLEFDHINALTKTYPIAAILCHKPEKVLAELKKCQLLCHGCHVQKTIENQESGYYHPNIGTWEHGTATTYRDQKCRCDKCRAAYAIARKDKYARLGT